MTRTVEKAADLAALPQVEVVEADLARPETLPRALSGVERAMLISSSDPMMLEVQTNFILAAERAGVRHVVKLSGIIPGLGLAVPLRAYARRDRESASRPRRWPSRTCAPASSCRAISVR